MSLFKILENPLSSRGRLKRISTIVVHATAGSTLSGALDTLRKRGFSYHYIIDKCGSVVQCVRPELVAFHAGKSVGPDGDGVNAYSVGISLVNKNNGFDIYTTEQKNSLEKLITTLKEKLISINYLTTHRQISWPRKNDPVEFGSYLRSLSEKLKLTYYSREGVPE